MLKQIIIFISFTLMVCLAADTTTPEPALICVDTCEVPNGFFVDKTNPHVFYECSHNKCVAAFKCQLDLVFSNKDQVCVKDTAVINLPCPGSKANGSYPYPGNPHKYIECFEGRGYERVCSGDLIFVESKGVCDFNDDGLTWPTDPPAPTTPKPVPTTAAPVQTTAAPVVTQKATTAPVVTTPAPVATADCTYKDFREEPTDKHKYRVCKNGKEVVVPCPDTMSFDTDLKTCD